jgi:hypothetical protein
MKNIILTNYLCDLKDPQNNEEWTKDNQERILKPLLDSAKKQDCEVVVLEETGDDDNPYFQRWINIEKYLEKNTDIEKVFCVDASDILVLKNPFETLINGIVYIGTQNDKVGTLWLIYNHNSYPEVDFINLYRDYKLLNAGILGGYRETVLEYVKEINKIRRETKEAKRSLTDMAIFNLVGWTKFKSRIVIGKNVNTDFGQFEVNDVSWFKHK